MPVIQCDIREGRTEEEKQAMAEGITRVVHETIGSPIEYIYVLYRSRFLTAQYTHATHRLPTSDRRERRET